MVAAVVVALVIHSLLSFSSLLYVRPGQPLGRLVVTYPAAADDNDTAEVVVSSPHRPCWILKHQDSEPVQSKRFPYHFVVVVGDAESGLMIHCFGNSSSIHPSSCYDLKMFHL